MARRPPIDDSKPIWQTLSLFLIPLMLSNILQSASGTFTSIFLGHLIGVGALAAASSIFPMLFFLISFFIGISSGSTVLIGQAYGAQNTPQVERIAGTTLTIAVVFGAVIGVVGLAANRGILTLIGTPPDIFAGAEAYARVIFVTMPITFVFLGYSTFVRGVGDSRTPFFALLGATIVSVIFAPPLITGSYGFPRLGIIGAPIANIGGSLIGLIGMLIYFEWKRAPLPLSVLLRNLAIDLTLLRAIVKIGLPTGLQLVMVSLSEIAVIVFVNRFGSQATAAYGAVNQVVSYVQFPAISIGIAASIFGSQSIGAKRYDRIDRIVRSAVTLNYLIEGALIAIVYLFARAILALFVTDAQTLDIARDLLGITLWSYALFGNNSVLSGIMRSSGTVVWPTLITVLAIWGIEVPVAYLLSHGSAGLRGVWIAYPIAYACALTAQFAYYRFVWKRRTLRPLLAPAT